MTDSTSSGAYSHNSTEYSQHERRKSRAWLWVVIILVLAVAGYWFFHRKSDPQQAARSGAPGGGGGGRAAFAGPVTVNTVSAKKGDLGVYLSAIGTVTPVYTSTITSQVSGLISSVHYREAQTVRKGDPLIDIDPRPFEAQLKQAEGTLE